MKNRRVTATELKNNTSAIINEVVYGRKPIDVYRHGVNIVTIYYAEKKEANLADKLAKLNKKWAGSMPDFPNVIKDRVNKDLDALYE